MPDWPRAGARLRRLFAKARRRPVPDGEGTPAVTPSGEPERYIAVAVDGLAGEELEKVLDTVVAIRERERVRIVVVTGGFDLAPFHDRGLPAERITDPVRQRFGDLPAGMRLEQQCAAIVRLWRPVELVRFAASGYGGWTEVLYAAIRAARGGPGVVSPPGG